MVNPPYRERIVPRHAYELWTHMREESTLMVAQTLLRIFPRLDNILYTTDRRWKEVVDAISVSKKNSLITQVRNTYLIHLEGTLTTLVSGATLENAIQRWNARNCVRPLSFQSSHHQILYLPQTALLDKAEHYGRRPVSDSRSRA